MNSQVGGEAPLGRFRKSRSRIGEIAQGILGQGTAAGVRQLDMDGATIPQIVRAQHQSLALEGDHGAVGVADEMGPVSEQRCQLLGLLLEVDALE